MWGRSRPLLGAVGGSQPKALVRLGLGVTIAACDPKRFNPCDHLPEPRPCGCSRCAQDGRVEFLFPECVRGPVTGDVINPKTTTHSRKTSHVII